MHLLLSCNDLCRNGTHVKAGMPADDQYRDIKALSMGLEAIVRAVHGTGHHTAAGRYILG